MAWTRTTRMAGIVILAGWAGLASAKETVTGTGNDTSIGKVTAILTTRDNGSMALGVSMTGVACTSVFKAPTDTAQESLVCSDGHNGNAILRLHDDGTPMAIAYFRGTAGSGSANFR